VYKCAVENGGGHYLATAHTQVVIDKVAKWFKDGKKWLFLMGKAGTGKSRMMGVIAELIRQYSARGDYFPYKMGCKNTTEIYEDCLSNERKHVIDGWSRSPYVGIDDLGTENVTTKFAPVADIIYRRYDMRENGKLQATVLCSNFNIDYLGKIYGERCADRLREMCSIIPFDFSSYRK
jgi:DNA replication protein DnaC